MGLKCTHCSQPVKPIVAVDIDGTLGDYHEHFTRFAEMYFNRFLSPPQRYDGSAPFWQYLGLDLRSYREAKLAYRQGGMKRNLPVFPHASAFTRELRMAGAEIWICTTRPYLRLDNVDPDTRAWLDRNGVAYDFMLYGETKYEMLAEAVDKGRVVGVLEDLPEQCEVARELGFDPVIRERPYNVAYRTSDVGQGLATAPTLLAAGSILEPRVTAWREQHAR